MCEKPPHARKARDPDAPYWLPEGTFYKHLPKRLRRAVGRVLNPAYRQLVLEAPDELQRSAGLTLVHLLWLEICDQLELGETVGDRESTFALTNNPEPMIRRHLRLVGAKCKATELLMKVRMFSRMMGGQSSVAGSLGDERPRRPEIPGGADDRLAAGRWPRLPAPRVPAPAQDVPAPAQDVPAPSQDVPGPTAGGPLSCDGANDSGGVGGEENGKRPNR